MPTELSHTEDGCEGIWFLYAQTPDLKYTEYKVACGGCAADYHLKEGMWVQAMLQNGVTLKDLART